jgi:WD40 repeat protein
VRFIAAAATAAVLLLLQVVSVVACNDGSHAASIGSDGCLRLWSLATGACLSNQVRLLESCTYKCGLTVERWLSEEWQ